MQTNGLDPEAERRKYVTAFNSTMIKIWRERIALLKVIDTGALYRSTLAVGMNADGKVTSVTLSQRFNTYGIFQDYGTGLNTVQTDTRWRCSNTPSLAALPIATTLRSHHRAHSRSRHRTTPGRRITATIAHNRHDTAT